MRYERQIPQFDNIVEIEAIDPVEFREARWKRRADKMERDALEVIESMVMKAKRKLRLIPDTIEDARRDFHLETLLGRLPSRCFGGPMQQMMGQASLQHQMAAQQNVASSPLTGLLGGAFGVLRRF